MNRRAAIIRWAGLFSMATSAIIGAVFCYRYGDHVVGHVIVLWFILGVYAMLSAR